MPLPSSYLLAFWRASLLETLTTSVAYNGQRLQKTSNKKGSKKAFMSNPQQPSQEELKELLDQLTEMNQQAMIDRKKILEMGRRVLQLEVAQVKKGLKQL